MAKTNRNAADYIVPLYINGMEGRMLHLPAPKNKQRDMLFVYGHHSSLERWWGVVQDLNQYGSVTMPDLPGFGGMDSFYKIDKEPSIDNLADYLAAFIKLRFRSRQITIAGLSFGFVVVTRMLQRYPELTKKIDLLVSVVGFAHKDDFTFSKMRYLCYLGGAKIFSQHLPAIVFKGICLRPLFIKLIYTRTHNAKHKFTDADSTERKKLTDFEIHLWRANDLRTWMRTTADFLRLDNCRVLVNLPVWHVSVKADRYFDNHLVEQHFRVIFSDYHEAKSQMNTHAPSVIADMKTGSSLLPKKIRDVLSR